MSLEDSLHTPRTAKITSIIENRRPLAQKIATAEENLKVLANSLRALEERHHRLIGQLDEPNTIGRLKAIDSQVLQEIDF